ncbi:hypothetical protein [Sphingomonas sp. S-NIH.Pt15_0812]|uniref:hypothetical protein n=1 Tax=Sphingomonas sp. S-NIH.Pt15_0812 TaxID=1920129 RepID=UPI000F7DE669|nr:hypothetical protein [Sphingomonas sp. S-NIH.Pt15_0812]
MGAALTAVTPRVLDMLDRRARQKTDITEQELQAIAKAMYEERLTEVCTLQRSTPYDVENHSAANLAFIDYFERLKNQGGPYVPSAGRRAQIGGGGLEREARSDRLRGSDPIPPIPPGFDDDGIIAAERQRWRCVGLRNVDQADVR